VLHVSKDRSNQRDAVNGHWPQARLADFPLGIPLVMAGEKRGWLRTREAAVKSALS